jgi:hypothetical protein
VYSDKCVHISEESRGVFLGSFARSNNGSRHVLTRMSVLRCFLCNGHGHLANNPGCPNYHRRQAYPRVNQQVNQQTNPQPGSLSSRSETSLKTISVNPRPQTVNQNFSRNVNSNVGRETSVKQPFKVCTFCNKSGHDATDCMLQKRQVPCRHCGRTNHSSNDCRFKNKSVNFVSAKPCIVYENSSFRNRQCLPHNVSSNTDYNGDILDDINIEQLFHRSNQHHVDWVNSKPKPAPEITPNGDSFTIPRGIVKLKIGSQTINSFIDSGADVTVLNSALVDRDLTNVWGNSTIKLRSAFGDCVDARLVSLPVAIVSNNAVLNIPLIFPVQLLIDYKLMLCLHRAIFIHCLTVLNITTMIGTMILVW